MGIIVGRWHFGEGDLPGDKPSAMAAIAGRLQAATGLHVVQRKTRFWIPALREELIGWEFDDRTVTVYSLIPAHPYLWENLDMVMTEAGATRDTEDYIWQPDPTRVPLRTRWDALSPRDRFLLALPSVWGMRPFDRLLSLTAR